MRRRRKAAVVEKYNIDARQSARSGKSLVGFMYGRRNGLDVDDRDASMLKSDSLRCQMMPDVIIGKSAALLFTYALPHSSSC